MHEGLKKRRSYYSIGKDIPVSQEEVINLVKDVVHQVPDSFNNKSQSVVLALGEYQDKLWDAIYDVFGGKVPREKIDSFKNGYGTVLYFIDKQKVENLKEQFPAYSDRFDEWSHVANGMLQINIWTELRNLGIGASIQHYNPVIDDVVKETFHVPKDWILVGQMPFGQILEEPEPKDRGNVEDRLKIFK